MTPFKLYMRFILIVSVTAFLGMACVNWWVDPYNEWGNNTIGLYFSTERQAKKEILNFPHDAILMGSSRTAAIPTKDLQCFTFYNASFANALPEEIYEYLKTYAFKEKLVVIGFDFYMFNERRFPMLGKNAWKDRQFGVFEYLLSWNVLRDSFIALHKRFIQHAKPMVSNDGQTVIEQDSSHVQTSPVVSSSSAGPSIKTSHQERIFMKIKTGETPRRKNKPKEPDPSVDNFDYAKSLAFLSDVHYRDFRFSHERINYLQKIKVLLEERGIEYIIFINPQNFALLNLFKELGYARLFDYWKAQVRGVFPDLIDFACCDYSNYVDFNPTDASHYKPAVGVEFLNSILQCQEK